MAFPFSPAEAYERAPWYSGPIGSRPRPRAGGRRRPGGGWDGLFRSARRARWLFPFRPRRHTNARPGTAVRSAQDLGRAQAGVVGQAVAGMVFFDLRVERDGFSLFARGGIRTRALVQRSDRLKTSAARRRASSARRWLGWSFSICA